MNVQLLDYELPAELVAQHPPDRRDDARLLVCDRVTGDVRHRSVADLPDEAGGRLVVVNDTRVVPARLAVRRASGGAVEVLLVERVADDALGGARPPVAPAPGGGDARRGRRVRRAARVARRRQVADPARGRAARRAAPAALHPRAARRPRALPDGLRDGDGLGRGADRGPPLHARAARAGRARADHAPRRAGHVPAGHGRDARGARAPRRAVSRRGGGLAADRGGRAGARRRDDDDPRPRDRRARRAARGPVRPLHHAGVSSSVGSTRC